LSEPTAFSGVEDRVLDAVFFGRDFKIRCVAQPVRLDSAMMVGPASKSRPVMVSGQSGLCPPFAPNSLASDDPSDDQVMVAGQQPFSASLSYVNASDPQHPDTMRIQVVVPHLDGLMPILSTQPLHGIRHVMSEPAYRSYHRCFNLHRTWDSWTEAIETIRIWRPNCRLNSPKATGKNRPSGSTATWIPPDASGISKSGTP
jgi:hypothetical protein